MKTDSAKSLLTEIEPLLRECAQRFSNASISKLSEKTAVEMTRKCGDMMARVEDYNKKPFDSTH